MLERRSSDFVQDAGQADTKGFFLQQFLQAAGITSHIEQRIVVRRRLGQASQLQADHHLADVSRSDLSIQLARESGVPEGSNLAEVLQLVAVVALTLAMDETARAVEDVIRFAGSLGCLDGIGFAWDI